MKQVKLCLKITEAQKQRPLSHSQRAPDGPLKTFLPSLWERWVVNDSLDLHCKTTWPRWQCMKNLVKYLICVWVIKDRWLEILQLLHKQKQWETDTFSFGRKINVLVDSSLNWTCQMNSVGTFWHVWLFFLFILFFLRTEWKVKVRFRSRTI